MSLYRFFFSACALAALVGCGESGPSVPAGEETKHLFSIKSSESVGDRVGNIALNEGGILLHPGETTPTTITFNLDGKYRSVVLKPFIAPLDEAGKANPDAGVVGVEFLIDGKSIDKFQVDRNSNLEKSVDLKGAKVLEVRVDNGNATPIWDWFTLKAVSIK